MINYIEDYINKYTINELVLGSLFIFVLFYLTRSFNINLLQFMLIICVVITILYISNQKDETIKHLYKNILFEEKNTQIASSKSESLIIFIDKIKYFKLYNPPVYDSFLNKIDEYIKLLKFIDVHTKENYKLYPIKILQENLLFQRKDIINTFLSFVFNPVIVSKKFILPISSLILKFFKL